jgi:hypothetical protein
MTHAGKAVTIGLADTSMRVIDQHGELIATVPRNGTGEISRFKAYGTAQAANGGAGGDQTSRVTAATRHDRVMSPPAPPLNCRRCGRPVDISRDQYDVFEQMHYVCFHYEYGHAPVDPDEECGAGGCPSQSVNPRPDRRPGQQPPRPDTVLAGSWTWHPNLRRFLELVSFYAGYSFDGSDWLAIENGLEGLQARTRPSTTRSLAARNLASVSARTPTPVTRSQ